tara:strand:+ start:388 stop:501 length:114 start_codon:yes stop_codon:yes gene_type:complete
MGIQEVWRETFDFIFLRNSLILKENMVEGMGFEPMIP